MTGSDEGRGPQDAPGPRSPVRDLAIAAAGFVALVGAGLLLTRPGVGPDGPGAAAPPAGAERPADLFVGDRACAECHPGESAYHARSGHSRTLRPAEHPSASRPLAGKSARDDEAGADWSYGLRDGRLVATRAAAGSDPEAFLLDFAFGSGRHATTYVSLTGRGPDGPSALEHRMTYFAADDAPGITPGQSGATEIAPEELGPAGRALDAEATLECFGCHATLLSSEGGRDLDPATLVPNVGCERCHGPGRDHVAEARRGGHVGRMPFGAGQGTADLQMRLCGQCHRHPDKAPPGTIHPDNPEIVRFQPVGLMQSECYTRSEGALRCTTCHDPHDRASTDLARHEAACLSCHASATSAPCPVSPEAGCIACHMPARDSGQAIPFHDHWIRVHPPIEPAN